VEVVRVAESECGKRVTRMGISSGYYSIVVGGVAGDLVMFIRGTSHSSCSWSWTRKVKAQGCLLAPILLRDHINNGGPARPATACFEGDCRTFRSRLKVAGFQ
jgi:hypothetical protein